MTTNTKPGALALNYIRQMSVFAPLDSMSKKAENDMLALQAERDSFIAERDAALADVAQLRVYLGSVGSTVTLGEAQRIARAALAATEGGAL